MADYSENKINISKADVNPITVTFKEKEVFTFNLKTIDKVTQYVLAAGTALNDMSDVTISGADDNHILRYSFSASAWINVLMSDYLESFVGGSQVIMSGGKINIDQSKIDHNLLLNYVVEQHRIINDDGTLATELFSASKINTLVDAKADTDHTHTEADVVGLDKYTQGEVDVLLAAKAILGHSHTESDVTDLDKYTQGEVDILLTNKSNWDDAYTHSQLITGNPHNVSKLNVALGNVDNVQQLPLAYLDTDGTLGANSDTKVVSQKAAKTYIDLTGERAVTSEESGDWKKVTSLQFNILTGLLKVEYEDGT